MIGELKPYADYKDSGLPWLGQVPRHWDVRRIKTVLREVDRRSSTGREALLSLRMQSGLVDHHALGGKPIPPAALIGYKRVLPGEIVMNRMRASAGLFAAAASDGLVSPDYAIFRPVDQVDVTYVVQLFRTPAMAAVFRLESTGLGTGESGFLRLYSDQFGRLAIPIPPAAEQAAIMRFLDWATGRLDRAIRAKRKVIALLTEQKLAIMRRALTRGLDLSMPLKSTGVHWLGDVPQHWEVRRLKSILRLQRGFDLPADQRRKGTVPVFSSGGHIDNHDTALAAAPGIVIGRYGSTEAVFFVDEPYWPHNTALFTTTLYDNSARWCYYLLRSIPKDQYAGKSAVPGVDRKDLFDIRVPKPPLEEQRAIALEIDGRLTAFEKSITAIQKEIQLLREYRTRLVADVVTGKLDVHEAVPRLPDEAVPDIVEAFADKTDEADLADEETAA